MSSNANKAFDRTDAIVVGIIVTFERLENGLPVYRTGVVDRIIRWTGGPKCGHVREIVVVRGSLEVHFIQQYHDDGLAWKSRSGNEVLVDVSSVMGGR